MADEKVIDTFSNSIDHDISITIDTIHGCKGMSLDSVLFVSSYTKSANSSSTHWRDWFQHNETGISEADKQMLTDCGFEIVEIAED